MTSPRNIASFLSSFKTPGRVYLKRPYGFSFRSSAAEEWPPDALMILRAATNTGPDETLKKELETRLKMPQGPAR